MDTEDKKKEPMTSEELEGAAGGGYFDLYPDEFYLRAGVDIIGPGYLYNDGFAINGQEISRSDAYNLAYYYHLFNKRAQSVEQAKAAIAEYEATL